MLFSLWTVLGRRLAVVSLLLAVSLQAAWSQSVLNQGRLSGTVADATGEVIVGAAVTVSSPDSTIMRRTTTGSDGGFTVAGLPSGTYELSVSVPGFAPHRNSEVAIAVGRETRVNVQLAPARTAQHVTVQAQTESLDPSQTSPVANIDRDRIEELPIPSRNYLNFALLSPAVEAANPAQSHQAPGTEASGFSAGGLRPCEQCARYRRQRRQRRDHRAEPHRAFSGGHQRFSDCEPRLPGGVGRRGGRFGRCGNTIRRQSAAR